MKIHSTSFRNVGVTYNLSSGLYSVYCGLREKKDDAIHMAGWTIPDQKWFKQKVLKFILKNDQNVYEI